MPTESVQIITPGYSYLATRDLKYVAGSGESSDINPFSPNSDRPLIMGEFLKYTMDGAIQKLTRGGDNSAASADDAVGPEFMYFRYAGEPSINGKAHVITQASGWVFRTTVCSIASSATETFWTVKDISVGGIVRRIPVVAGSGDFIMGEINAVYGTNDVELTYNPGGHAP